jgi:hypothetical protein
VNTEDSLPVISDGDGRPGHHVEVPATAQAMRVRTARA